MSDAERNYLPVDNDAIETRASEWLARHVSEELTAEGQTELDDWLNESAAHRVAYLRLGGAWSQTERLAALRHPKFDSAAKSARNRALTMVPAERRRGRNSGCRCGVAA